MKEGCVMCITIPDVLLVFIGAVSFAVGATATIYCLDQWLNELARKRKNHKRKCKK